MIRVLGVDGGQSGIRLCHSVTDRIVEVEGVSRQEGDTVSAVTRAVVEGWRRVGAPRVDRVVLGLTTAPADASGSERLCGLVGEATGAPEVWLADDAVTSHVGALSGCPGVSLVAGTGVACLALRQDGEPRIIGGHGYLLGDEGGAFWLGRRGLGAALRALDGRGTTTTLTLRAEERFGRLEDLHVRLHDADRPVDAIARFAPDVLAAAGDGDRLADEIVDEAARELLLVASAGAAWAASGGEPVPLALGGRLLAPGSELLRRLDALLATSSPPVQPRDPDASPLDGAIALGRQPDPRPYQALVHVWRAGMSS